MLTIRAYPGQFRPGKSDNFALDREVPMGFYDPNLRFLRHGLCQGSQGRESVEQGDVLWDSFLEFRTASLLIRIQNMKNSFLLLGCSNQR